MDRVTTEHKSGVMPNQHRMQGESRDLGTREIQRFASPPAGSADAPDSPNTQSEQDWPLRVLNEIQDMLLLLSSDGKVLYASPSCKSITGYDAGQLQQNTLTRFIHNDDKTLFSEEMNACIATTRPMQCYFRFCTKDNNNNASCLLEACGHPHMKTVNPSDSPEKRSGACLGIILLCRLYPSRSSHLLDSWLEHKIENVRLNERIAQLRQEEEEDLATEQQLYPGEGESTSCHGSAHSGRSGSLQPSFQDTTASGEENESSDTLTNDDPDSRLYSENAADRQEEEAEDMSHINVIEMLTGLHYSEGERSQGLSTGSRQARLVHYDMTSGKVDQHTPIIQDSDRKKRQKGEYMCTDCGTSDSPEWRKGPEGPKTLCNACGLRWAKKEKKRQDHI